MRALQRLERWLAPANFDELADLNIDDTEAERRHIVSIALATDEASPLEPVSDLETLAVVEAAIESYTAEIKCLSLRLADLQLVRRTLEDYKGPTRWTMRTDD